MNYSYIIFACTRPVCRLYIINEESVVSFCFWGHQFENKMLWQLLFFFFFNFCPKQAQSRAHLYPEFYLVYMEGGMTKLMDAKYIYNLLCTVQKWISELELRVVQATRLRSGAF